jgi:ribonuclease HI
MRKRVQLNLYFDGGNEKDIAAWAVVGIVEQTVIAKLTGLCDYRLPQTNNIAEWSALYHAILFAHTEQENYDEILIMGDSELVVKQINGEYAVGAPHLKPFLKKSKGVLDKIKTPCKIQWIPREKNTLPDSLGRTLRELDKRLKGR